MSMLLQMTFADPRASTEQPGPGSGDQGRTVLALDMRLDPCLML